MPIPETPYTRKEVYLDYIARNGSGGGGGGGGSAYREATLTITNTKAGSHITYADGITVQNGETAVAFGDVVGDSTPHSITLLLGPSGTSIYIDADTVTSLDGDIEAVPDERLYHITGDASLSAEGWIDS